ncbi:MAG: glycoside hydrolase family 3 protein, partial [Lachnospiraceae bacterium]|nr:glycoside hydrolase family 3 protein [Lachnospiraceae bacterium]
SSVMVNDVLRNTLGFQGVVMTDYLDDSAITDNYSSAEAAVAAIQAGADILLAPEDYQEAYEGVLQAVTDGTITQERIHDSVYRIYRIKYKNVIESL